MSREKRDKLYVRYSKREEDIEIHYPNKWDGGLAHSVFATPRRHLSGFDPSFIDELKKRGYDITTLKFQISKRKGYYCEMCDEREATKKAIDIDNIKLNICEPCLEADVMIKELTDGL